MDRLSLLILAAHPVESASTRYRIVQFIPYLKSCGINATVCTFLSPKNYRLIYGKGKFLVKIFALIFAEAQIISQQFAATSAQINSVDTSLWQRFLNFVSGK